MMLLLKVQQSKKGQIIPKVSELNSITTVVVAPRGPVGDVMIDTGVMRNFVAESSNMRHVQKAVVGNRRMFATQTAVDEFRAAMVRTGSLQEQLRANRLLNRLTVVPDNPSASFSALTPSRNIGANGQIFDPALHPLQRAIYWGGGGYIVYKGGELVWVAAGGE